MTSGKSGTGKKPARKEKTKGTGAGDPPAAPISETGADLALRCAILPAHMRIQKNLAQTQDELAQIVAQAAPLADTPGAALVLGSTRTARGTKTFHPDAMANLWFVRAA